MGVGIEFPRSCQAWEWQDGRVNPHGMLWATASSLGCRNMDPCGVSAKSPRHPFSEAGGISVAPPYV